MEESENLKGLSAEAKMITHRMREKAPKKLENRGEREREREIFVCVNDCFPFALFFLRKREPGEKRKTSSRV